jgi:hypothetical protein
VTAYADDWIAQVRVWNAIAHAARDLETPETRENPNETGAVQGGSHRCTGVNHPIGASPIENTKEIADLPSPTPGSPGGWCTLPEPCTRAFSINVYAGV